MKVLDSCFRSNDISFLRIQEKITQVNKLTFKYRINGRKSK